jgi:hypothetical protein
MSHIRSVIHGVHTTDHIEIRTHADADTDSGQGPSSKTYGHADFGLTQKEVFISCNITDHFMLFVPCIVISNTNQRNAQYSKLVFNFCCVLHVSNVVG